MTLIVAQRNRGTTRNIVIQDANGNTITPGVADLVQIRIGREGETEKLTVTSGTVTANGSSITKGATNVLRLDASDLDFEPGTYTMYVEYFDNADAAEWKEVDRQVFVLEAT